MGLETKLDTDMGWFFGKNKRIKEHTTEHFDPSRRDFLIKSGQVVGGVAAATVAPSLLGLEKEAQAWKKKKNSFGNFEILPSGIQISKDDWLKLLYGEVEGHWTVSSHDASFGKMFIRNYRKGSQIHEETPYLDPAYYLLREKALHHDKIRERYLGRNIPDSEELLLNNPALSFFSTAIEFYFKGWISRENYVRWRRERNKDEAEKFFIYSLYSASNPYTSQGIKKSVEEGDAFLAAINSGKVSLAQELMKRFDRMGKGNKQSNDPNNPYNRQLVASWSAFMVTTHSGKREDNWKMIYNQNLEIPLRKYTGKIRGPPNYNI